MSAIVPIFFTYLTFWKSSANHTFSIAGALLLLIPQPNVAATYLSPTFLQCLFHAALACENSQPKSMLTLS